MTLILKLDAAIFVRIKQSSELSVKLFRQFTFISERINVFTVINFISDLQTVVIGQSITVSPLFHQRGRLIFPMMHHTRIVNVGTSSFTMENIITDAKLGDVLVSGQRTFAFTNKYTKKSQQLSQQMR